MLPYLAARECRVGGGRPRSHVVPRTKGFTWSDDVASDWSDSPPFALVQSRRHRAGALLLVAHEDGTIRLQDVAAPGTDPGMCFSFL
jgi:hypothetical protein